MMTEWQSRCVDALVDRIDALVVMRAERMDTKVAAEACEDLRVALADAITDLMAAAKETA